MRRMAALVLAGLIFLGGCSTGAPASSSGSTPQVSGETSLSSTSQAAEAASDASRQDGSRVENARLLLEIEDHNWESRFYQGVMAASRETVWFWADEGEQGKLFALDLRSGAVEWVCDLPDMGAGITLPMPMQDRFLYWLDVKWSADGRTRNDLLEIDLETGEQTVAVSFPLELPFVGMSPVSDSEFLILRHKTEGRWIHSILSVFDLERRELREIVRYTADRTSDNSEGELIEQVDWVDGEIHMIVTRVEEGERVCDLRTCNLEGEVVRNLPSEALSAFLRRYQSNRLVYLKGYLFVRNQDMNSAVFELRGEELVRLEAYDGYRLISGYEQITDSEGVPAVYLFSREVPVEADGRHLEGVPLRRLDLQSGEMREFVPILEEGYLYTGGGMVTSTQDLIFWVAPQGAVSTYQDERIFLVMQEDLEAASKDR